MDVLKEQVMDNDQCHKYHDIKKARYLVTVAVTIIAVTMMRDI